MQASRIGFGIFVDSRSVRGVVPSSATARSLDFRLRFTVPRDNSQPTKHENRRGEQPRAGSVHTTSETYLRGQFHFDSDRSTAAFWYEVMGEAAFYVRQPDDPAVVSILDNHRIARIGSGILEQLFFFASNSISLVSLTFFSPELRATSNKPFPSHPILSHPIPSRPFPCLPNYYCAGVVIYKALGESPSMRKNPTAATNRSGWVWGSLTRTVRLEQGRRRFVERSSGQGIRRRSIVG